MGLENSGYAVKNYIKQWSILTSIKFHWKEWHYNPAAWV